MPVCQGVIIAPRQLILILNYCLTAYCYRLAIKLNFTYVQLEELGLNIEIIDQEANDVVGQLTAGLRQFNVEHLGDEATQPLTIVARNTTGDIVGGVVGRTIYKNLLINLVWIDAHYRGQGLGQKLMQVAQTQAIKRGCLIAQLDTLDFQAPGFYQKLGFIIIGTVPKFPGSPERYFMMKHLSCNETNEG